MTFDSIESKVAHLHILQTTDCNLDCEQSLFFFRFSESNARARERRSRETRETKAAVPLPSRAISHGRGHLRVSRFARQTTEKRETARSLIVIHLALTKLQVGFWGPFLESTDN